MSILSSLSLEQSSLLKLIELKLTDGSIIRLCDKYDIVYLGKTYRFLNFELSDLQEVSSNESIRPKLSIVNPNGVFSKLAISNKLEGGLVDIIRVEEGKILYGDTSEVFVDRWKIYSIPEISQKITLQLRKLSDLKDEQIPPRKYSPPDFPTVKIQ